MAGLDPAIHIIFQEIVDARLKAGHDEPVKRASIICRSGRFLLTFLTRQSVIVAS
jgi:hypothetical protein